jgi:hypothetical protein
MAVVRQVGLTHTCHSPLSLSSYSPLPDICRILEQFAAGEFNQSEKNISMYCWPMQQLNSADESG